MKRISNNLACTHTYKSTSLTLSKMKDGCRCGEGSYLWQKNMIIFLQRYKQAFEEQTLWDKILFLSPLCVSQMCLCRYVCVIPIHLWGMLTPTEKSWMRGMGINGSTQDFKKTCCWPLNKEKNEGVRKQEDIGVNMC